MSEKRDTPLNDAMSTPASLSWVASSLLVRSVLVVGSAPQVAHHGSADTHAIRLWFHTEQGEYVKDVLFHVPAGRTALFDCDWLFETVAAARSGVKVMRVAAESDQPCSLAVRFYQRNASNPHSALTNDTAPNTLTGNALMGIASGGSLLHAQQSVCLPILSGIMPAPKLPQQESAVTHDQRELQNAGSFVGGGAENFFVGFVPLGSDTEVRVRLFGCGRGESGHTVAGLGVWLVSMDDLCRRAAANPESIDYATPGYLRLTTRSTMGCLVIPCRLESIAAMNAPTQRASIAGHTLGGTV